jgi:hypothetical protein
MPPAYLPVPTTHAEASSAWIRQVRTKAIEDFIDGTLTAEPGLSDEQVAVLIGYAGDFAARIVDACCSPGASAVLREIAAREAGPGEEVPA